MQITNKCNAVLSTIDASFQKLDTVSRNMDIFGNDLLVVLVSAFPIPSRRAVGDRVREHLQHHGAALARLGVPGPRHDKTDSAPSIRQCRVGHAGVDAAFSNLGDGHGFT